MLKMRRNGGKLGNAQSECKSILKMAVFPLQAYEARGENYYCFSFNTKGVTSVSDASSRDLVNGVFAFEEGRIVCTLTDDHLSSPQSYSYWTYPGAVLTFVKEPIPEA